LWPAVHLLLISGSTRAGSTNTAALRTLADEASRRGIDAVLYDGLAALPAFDPDDDHDPLPPRVAALREGLDRADVAVFCTPEYAGMMPGALKNLLDWCVGGGLWRKPVAYVNVAIEGRGDSTIAGLRTVLGYVEAQIVEDACRRVFIARDRVGEDGMVADHEIRAELAGVLDALAASLGD
jgi:NAD(P)H-dependent FMN reductase